MRESVLEEGSDGVWVARVKAPPDDGRSNEALVALVARRFCVPRSRVAIETGASGRRQLVTIDD
jgi:uncharacterized protein